MVDWGKTILGGIGIAYVLSPIDLIPEALLGPFGLADDAAVAVISVPMFLSGIGAEETAQKASKR